MKDLQEVIELLMIAADRAGRRDDAIRAIAIVTNWYHSLPATIGQTVAFNPMVWSPTDVPNSSVDL